MLEFDADTHRYTLDGRDLPSVTRILSRLSDYSRIPPAVLEAARDRGTRVHAACSLEVLGVLDEATVDDEVAPYLRQFRRFLRESGFVPTLTECRVCDPDLGYAGTLDLFGNLAGWKSVLMDIKTGTVPPTTGPQTAAYVHALHVYAGIEAQRRYVLNLTRGRYTLTPLDDARDFAVFREELERYKAGASNGESV